MKDREHIVGMSIKLVFVLFTFVILVYFVWGQLNYPRETDERNTYSREYAEGWYQIKSDGTQVAITVPGQYEVEEGREFVAVNKLPAEVDDDDWLCFRTAKQDVEIYVGDELRKTYSTEGKRPFGTYSVSMYVFVDLEPADAGKPITFKAWSSDDTRTGVMRAVHYGDKFAIWLHLLLVGGLETLITLFMLIVGFISVAIIGIVNVRYRKHIEVEYLCWGVLLVSVWLITQSDVRQLFFPNVSVANSMTYFTIMLAPVPFLIYVDDVQEHRYRKAHMIAAVLGLINFLFCAFLQFAGIRDLMDMSLLIFVGIGVAFVVIAATLILDLKRGYLKEYKLAAIGFVGAIVLASVRMINFYDVSVVAKGTGVALGVLFLLLMATVKSITDVLKLERQKQEAVVASQAKARFLASISHEIRTPINAVLGMDEMILRECNQDNIKDYAMDIRNAGKTLLSLINDVLDMSKIESGKMEIIPSEYDVYKLMDSCYNLVVMGAKGKQLELKVANDETLPKTLYGDEVRIRQIIVNLLTNAVKYTKQGSITYKMGYREMDDDNIMLSIMVSDTGIGISKESQAVLFDAYERFDENNTRYIEGSGLGLNIVKQLVELMGGTISVHSEHGNGSVFTVFIPQRVVTAEPMGEYKPEQPESDSDYEYKEMFMAPDAQVLVVDDNTMNIRVFRGLLKSTGVNIDSAENGATCLELIKKKKYDIIFLDHMMPGMDGIEVMTRMKQMSDSINSSTPVVMLTANAVSGAREEYVQHGFIDYITKPMRHIELENMLIKYLPKSKLLGCDEKVAEYIDLKHESEQAETKLEVKDFDFLDVEEGLSGCYNDEKYYLDMVKMFVQGDKLSLIQGYYDKDDWLNYRLQVHSIRSTAHTIGAEELSELAKAIEVAVKGEDYMYVHRNHTAMLNLYEELLGRIRGVLNSKI